MSFDSKEHMYSKENILLSIFLTLIGVACFPINPLILFGFINTNHYQVLYILGWIFWGIGMLLVMAPIIVFPRKGGVEKGKSFVNTTCVVDSGIYSIVRHPQYLGGIFSLFITTFLWYPHIVFGILGIIGIITIYFSCKEEEKRLINKFGNRYKEYMKRVPRLNILLGIYKKVFKS